MEPEKKSHGALIGSIIVIIILVVGGIYIWQTKVKQMQLQNEKAEMEAKLIEEQNAKELELLEQDLDTTDLNLEAELDKIE